MKTSSTIPNLGLHVLQYPSGRFGFVGRVPVELAWVGVDGGPADPEQVELAHRFGPGLAKKIKGATWATRAEAIAAANALGFEVLP